MSTMSTINNTPATGVCDHWSNAFMGVTYAIAGESRAGAHCWGFFRLVMRERFGIEVPAVDAVAPESGNDAKGLRRMLGAWQTPENYGGWSRLPVADAQEGDAVLLAHRDGWPDHIGVVVSVEGGGLRLLHCARGLGSAREPLERVLSRWRFSEVWRHCA
jgi:cell wall-associated NlpC family hydrolase